MKRWLIVLIVLAGLTALVSISAYDGPLRGVNADIEATILGSSTWYAPPDIVARATDPDGVYVIAPLMPAGNKFAAVRVSVATGAQTPVDIEIGPSSGFRRGLPDEKVRAVVHGLRFNRPAFHLMRLGGGGPGLHATDSATGRIDIVFDEGGRTRRLLTQRAFNSDRILERLACVSVDPGGQWIAATSRGPGGWTLFVFRRGASPRA